MKITKNMYRKALHFYLIHAYPDDDVSYYSKWAFLVNDFWNGRDGFDFPNEVRFGCHVSGHTKLRCYPTGFMFDINCVGDSDEVVKEVMKIAKKVESDWDKFNIPIHMRNETRS